MIRDWLSPARTAALALSVPSWEPQIGPWTDDSGLAQVPWPWFDIFGTDTPPPLTRGEALLVPAVARGRHLICATIAGLPLQVWRGDAPVPEQPAWCQGSDGQLGDLDAATRSRLGLYTAQSTFGRMLDTADDLLFYGWSIWLVTRWGAADPSGRRLPLRMCHLPYGSWDVGEGGVITDPDGQPYPEGAVIVFQGIHEGLLALGSRTIRSAGVLETAAADTAAHPLRFELHQTTDVTLTGAEREALVGETRAALARNDGILFTNSALETKTHQAGGDQALLIGGRNAAALDIARHLNMPGAMIDATTEGASLEYQTTVSRNQQWLDYGLTAYLNAITARLSMDDVVPAGQRTVFDTSSLTATVAPPTGPTLED